MTLKQLWSKFSLVFTFDVTCPFAYQASCLVRNKQSEWARKGYTVLWQPVLLGGLYKLSAAPQGKDKSASTVYTDARRRYSFPAILRDAERNGVLRGGQSDADLILAGVTRPAKTLLAQRLLALVSLRDGAMVGELAWAMFEAHWRRGLDIEDVHVLLDLARQCGVGAGVDERALGGDEVKRRLLEATELAVECGAFGVPTFFVNGGDTMAWGADRLFLAERAMGLRDARPDRHVPRALAAPERCPRTVEFFYDYASPWTFLAAMQIRRVFQEAGVVGQQLKLTPVLLGALFKRVGQVNVPMAAMAEVKRAYMIKDLALWADYWSEPVLFPSTFPLRTVLPLRATLVEPSLFEPLFRAAWQRDINIGDADQLRRVIAVDAGLGDERAQQVLDDATLPRNKEALRENTERAIELGCFGVPSFVVDNDRLIFGQDRLNLLADILCGWRSKFQLHKASL
jgi:2-hydroxychromene-2-carboxylate isomerase